MFHAFTGALDLIHVPAVNCADFFQRIDHPVDSRDPDVPIRLRRLKKDFFTACAFILQDNIDQHQTLLCDSASIVFQLCNDFFFLFRLIFCDLQIFSPPEFPTAYFARAIFPISTRNVRLFLYGRTSR